MRRGLTVYVFKRGGCGFDERELKKMNNIHFRTLVTKQTTALSSSTQHEMSQKVQRSLAYRNAIQRNTG